MSVPTVTQPLPPSSIPLQPEEKTDWLKITSIAICVIAGITLAYAFFCTNGTFPIELCGGKFGVATVATLGLCILSVGGSLFYYHWGMKQP